MTADAAFGHEDTYIDIAEAEQLGALAGNWLVSQDDGDAAAAEAFEDELHERMKLDEIKGSHGLDPASGEPSLAETERLREVLEHMWNNASLRLS